MRRIARKTLRLRVVCDLMPVQAVRSGADFVEIDQGGRRLRVTEADVTPGSKQKMAVAIQALLQEGLTFRQRVRDLPDNDLDKTLDPSRGGVSRSYRSGAVVAKALSLLKWEPI